MSWNPTATETHATSKQSARTYPVGIGVQHHAAMLDLDTLIEIETNPALREVSSHLAVKNDRRAGIVINEQRAWSLSSQEWDSKAFTIECCNETLAPGYTISDASYHSCAIAWAAWFTAMGTVPTRSGDPQGWTLIGHSEVYTIHGASYATACPGGIDMNRMLAETLAVMNGATSTGDEMEALLWVNDPTNPKIAQERPCFIYSAGGASTGDIKRTIRAAYAKAWFDAQYRQEVPIGTFSGTWADLLARLNTVTGVPLDLPVLANESRWTAINGIDGTGVGALVLTGSGGGGASVTQVQKIVDAQTVTLEKDLAKLPTAAQNGDAARAAIVKP